MIKQYRKKPVAIEAVLWDGNNASEIQNFCGDAAIFIQQAVTDLFIKSLEGDHHASVGDYIIKGVHGEFYACKPDIFAETYEACE